MALKLLQSTEKCWVILRGFKPLADAIVRAKFVDDEKQETKIWTVIAKVSTWA
jgi:hypothetical protein